MLAFCCLAIGWVTQTAPVFAPAVPWALNFAAPPRIPLVGDVNADGLADLLCVYPEGDCIIDVSLNVEGQKPSFGFQARTGWGKNCQAAVSGDFDGDGKADVLGLFDGSELVLAGDFGDRKFRSSEPWASLPRKVSGPELSWLQAGEVLLVRSRGAEEGFTIRLKDRKVSRVRLPKGAWFAGPSEALPGGDGAFRPGWLLELGGTLRYEGRELARLNPVPATGRPSAQGTLAAIGGSVFDSSKPDAGQPIPLVSNLPASPSHYFFADMDADGDDDLVEYRYGVEPHTAFAIMVHRRISPGEADSDRDGIRNEQEIALGTDPFDPDTDRDGLLDGWEIGSHRRLDFKALGCDPLQVDIICLLSRFDNLDEGLAKSEIQRAVEYFASLPATNKNGKTGWQLHPIWINVLEKDDQKLPWQALRDKYLPPNWRGMAHWMQLNPYGGGQADQLGDGGGSGGGKNTLFATFVHELGHQIGLDHQGFWRPSHCPIYRSLMNYAYSYSLEDDPLKIGFSFGEFRGLELREGDLDEELPLPYEKVKFLEKGPYRYRLKENGSTTLIDWNWNGVFGEKHIQADINYAYSTNAGLRDTVGKTMAAPWWIVAKGSAYLLSARHAKNADPPKSPDISEVRPGGLYLRRLESPTKWSQEWTIESEDVIGDPVGAEWGEELLFVYQTPLGVALRTAAIKDGTLILRHRRVLNLDKRLVPTVGRFRGRPIVFLWSPITQEVQYIELPDRPLRGDYALPPTKSLGLKSTIAPGLVEDPLRNELVVGLAQDQDAERKSRWQIRRYDLRPEGLAQVGELEWVGGAEGRAAGNARCTLLFDASPNAGESGRVLFFSVGLRGADSPWACGYVAMQVADKTAFGGWLVKRYYDEWTQSRSSIAAAWWEGEILYAYRWVDGGQGVTDNNLHVGYRGSGIDREPMGDHDDLAFLSGFGIQHSIKWMNP